MWQKTPRVALFGLDAFAAVTAIGGGIALMTGLEGNRFPPTLLQGTPFRDYVLPGLILAGAVGGSAAVAAVATWRDSRVGARASVLAGAVMMAWIAGEVALLDQDPPWTPTEVFYFAVGAGMAGLGGVLARS